MPSFNNTKNNEGYYAPDSLPKNKKSFEYPAGDLFNEAEVLRKAGHIDKAIKKYWESIKTGEKSKDWRGFGPAPAMYRELAKLYYHTGHDKEALRVLDRYIDLQKQHGNNVIEFENLRERMAKGDFRRLKNKYS